jgi:hypothetical protein
MQKVILTKNEDEAVVAKTLTEALDILEELVQFSYVPWGYRRSTANKDYVVFILCDQQGEVVFLEDIIA